LKGKTGANFQPLGVRKTPISPPKDDHNNGPDQLWAQAIATAWADTLRTQTLLELQECEIQVPEGLHFSWCPWYCPYYRTERPWNASIWARKWPKPLLGDKVYAIFLLIGSPTWKQKAKEQNDFGWDLWLVWRESSLCCSCRFSRWSPENLSI
jgi:hypothetical protein